VAMLSNFLKSLGVYRVYEEWLIRQIQKHQMPGHIAVILDGNRRWAIERELPSTAGHKYGVKVGEGFLEWCFDLDIKTVTLYIFSNENFKRTEKEVNDTLKIIENEAIELKGNLKIHENKIRIKTIGKKENLPKSLQTIMNELEETTKKYSDYYLNIAIAYGGRAEIIDAARKIASEVRDKKLALEEIDEDLFRNYLYTAHLPNPYPDLIIRTSGEERLSGFLLWQSAYSELCFLDVFWPDFRKIDLLRAIRTFQNRVRKFGL
jgi:tritrans,polycis-undecaprenyl-diphosphate synthase [geranylgeranyl-diphosphate specific]